MTSKLYNIHNLKGEGGSLLKLFTCTETKDYATRFLTYMELYNRHFRINKDRKEFFKLMSCKTIN